MRNHRPSITMPFWAYRKLLRPFFFGDFDWSFFCIVKVPVLFYQQLNKRNRKEDGMDAKNPPFQLFQRRFASNFFFLGDAGFNDWGDQLRFTAGSG